MGLTKAERAEREAQAAFDALSDDDKALLADLSEEDAAKLAEYAEGIAALASTDPAELVDGEPVPAPTIAELEASLAVIEQQFSSGQTTRKVRDAARERLRVARNLA